MVFQLHGWRARFERVSESPHSFEGGVTDELFEFFELFLGFAGEACDERCSKDEIRNRRSQLLDQFDGLGAVHSPLHPFQHRVVYVLQRHVQVRDDLLRLGDRLDDVVCKVNRVKIHQPDPVQAFDLFQLLQQSVQSNFAVQVHAVIGRVLSDDDQFPDAVFNEFASFLNDHFDRLGDMLAPHRRNGAEGAGSVAAF